MADWIDVLMLLVALAAGWGTAWERGYQRGWLDMAEREIPDRVKKEWQ